MTTHLLLSFQFPIRNTLVHQWYNEFYWKESIPKKFNTKQIDDILQRQGQTCAFFNCQTILEKEDVEFFHILSYLDQGNSKTGYGFAICKQCSLKFMAENSAWNLIN